MKFRLLSIPLLLLSFSGAAQKMPYFPCSPTLENPYGLTSEITRQSGEFNTRDEAVSLMRGIGVNTLRLPLGWDNFRAPDGRFLYTLYDPVMETVRESPFTALGVIDHSLGRGKDAWLSPGEFAACVRELVSRYRFYVSDWEVIPGMDEIRSARRKVTAAQYYSTLKGVSATVKSVNPGNRVVLGAPGDVSSKFLDSLFVLGATKYFDIMSFTAFGFPEAIMEQTLKIRRTMYRQGWSKPVWLTNIYYGSYMNPEVPTGFWREAVPAALKSLGMKSRSVEVAVVVSSSPKGKDALNRYEIEKYLSGLYKSVRLISADEIGTLSPSEVPVLIPGTAVNREDIGKYVREGGTIIIDSPRWPSITRCGILRSYSPEALSLKAPAVPDYVRAAKGYSFQCSWKFTENASARYLTADNLGDGDEMVPLIVAGNKEYEGCVAALYKIRSDGSKGNAIILSRKKIPEYVDQEAEQAKRIPRTHIIAFTCGVDKVIWNGMRSREKDPGRKRDWSGLYNSEMKPKPAASAYRTLTSMLPPGSTRPTFRFVSGVYLAEWRNAEGAPVRAVWTEGKNTLAPNITVEGNAQYTDCLGNRLKTLTGISDSIIYITGADSVVFNER